MRSREENVLLRAGFIAALNVTRNEYRPGRNRLEKRTILER
jgi:hypothetical protein